MTYEEWKIDNETKRKNLIINLYKKGKPPEKIIEYFVYENMQKAEPTFCGLYMDNTKCHDTNDLNCFFCGCPYFIFSDSGIDKIEDKTLFSKCEINAKQGAQFISDESIHHDCTGCEIPHKSSFAKKNGISIINEIINELD